MNICTWSHDLKLPLLNVLCVAIIMYTELFYCEDKRTEMWGNGGNHSDLPEHMVTQECVNRKAVTQLHPELVLEAAGLYCLSWFKGNGFHEFNPWCSFSF